MPHPLISQGPVEGRLAGKVILVTGTGGGQGRIAALLFARAGAQIVGCGRRPETLDETGKLAAAAGLRIDQSVVDAADPIGARAWVDAAAARYGGIDGIYNNAGFMHHAAVADMTASEWHETIRGELDIAFFPTQAAWPHLIRRGGGSIVNISSLSGMRGVEDTGAIAHAAAKGGVIAMTRQFALEGAPHWIRCNTISPGPVMTPGMETYLRHNPAGKRRVYGWPLLPRAGQSEDVAYAGLFLMSDESSWITGTNLPIDGGWSSKGGLTEH
jgi:meso-butanediol dehydrogenase/(S,S)-butanediol dehydrogenase/diacetyl reductase